MTHRSVLWAIRPGQLVLAFVVATGLMTAVGVLSYRDTARLVQAAEWSAHTLRVVSVLQDLKAQLHVAESNQRGYVITGRTEYVAGYATAAQAAAAARLELMQLTADNGAQQRRLTQLEPLIAARLAALDQGITLREQDGLSAGAAFISSGRGQQLMDTIGSLLDDMERDERALLRQREESERTTVRRTTATVIVGSAVSLCLLAGVFFVHSRGRRASVGTPKPCRTKSAASSGWRMRPTSS